MNRYLIESPHSGEQCLDILKQAVAAGYVTHFEWGCKAGRHTGWIILEAENEAQALLAVPVLVRPKATIVQLNRFSPEEVNSMHNR